MSALSFNMKNWPVILLTAKGNLTAADGERHLREYRQLLDRNQKFAVICDARETTAAEAKLRKDYAEFLKVNRDDLNRLCKGTAFVISSPLIRGALTAIMWMATMPYPYDIFGSIEEADVWAKAQL